MNRRMFIQSLAGAAAAGGLVRLARAAELAAVPPHLKGRERLFADNPRQAGLDWFREARFGMMPCYYLASLDGRHCFEQFQFRIPVKEMEKKAERFTAEKFCADAICDLAVAAGMKYVCFVTKHCEGFCLWNTRQTTFNSLRSAAKRDLVGEMVKACNARGLGFFAFYEYGFDWHHPHGPRHTDYKCRITEVPYSPPEPTYAYGKDYDLNRYIDYAHAQIEELLTNYGPIAGIWLDGVGAPLSGDRRKFRCQELYDKIHKLQPHALVSFKTGATGTEDFYAPERGQLQHLKPGDTKLTELCESLNPSWSYIKREGHRNADWVMERLAFTREKQMNFLLGFGPLPDGSTHPADVATLKEVGRRIRENGWPKGVKKLGAPKGEQEAF
jgi:alpha-L-fucosidase